MSRYNTFTFPEGLCDKTLFKNPKDKIVVVSVFGESIMDDNGFKAHIFNETLESTVFKMDDPPDLDEDTLSLIEGYYDRASQVLYLHLRSVEDTHYRCEAFCKEHDSGIKKKFHVRDAEFRYRHARALLVLFSISHIVILQLIKPSFSTSFIQLFRILESYRQRAAPLLSEVLREVPGISKEWVNQLRPCTPRLLFYADTCFIDVFEKHNSNKPIHGQPSVIKRFEHNFEDHLYRVLRKTRIITNSSCNSLFTIPANQEFVFVRLFLSEMKDELLTKTENLAAICNLVQPENASSEPDPTHKEKPFLQQHVDLAFTKGFDDRVGRHAPNAHFELATAEVWVKACKKVYSFFMEDSIEQKHEQLMAQLYSCFDAPVRFSEARCKKVLPLAVGAYQESLPTHYTKTYHQTRVAHAVSVLAQHARGASSEKYIKQLQEECDRYWRAGRQMCEVPSLTGNPCTNPIHRAIEEEEPCKEALTRDRLPTFPHSSGVRYVSACNCGRKQGPREDPFVLRTANCDFYAALAADCCSALENHYFPVFQPSVKNYQAARLLPSPQQEANTSRRESLRDTNSRTQGKSQFGFSSLVGTFFSGHSGGSEIGTEEVSRLSPHLLQHKDENNFPYCQPEIVIKITDTDSESSKEAGGKPTVSSTTEYLPGMPHTASPLGLLPQFPSWSLVCLGPSSLYSHNHGLTDQPGFLPGSGYLLPWDVTVRLEPTSDQQQHQTAVSNDVKWPLLGKPTMTSAQPHKQTNVRGRKSKVGQDQNVFVVKIFIGTEYECPRGHRFMCSAPDRILRASVSGLVKETGLRVAASDMPLYFPCPCRNGKPLIAQMMRIHVVTPKARVHVTLQPRVQPAPSPCPKFTPGLPEPIKLSQSAYWILRLPYIYAGEQGPYLPPKERVPLSYGRLLANTYGISKF